MQFPSLVFPSLFTEESIFTKINIFHGNLPQVIDLIHMYIINAILVTALRLTRSCSQFAWQGEVRNQMYVLNYGNCPLQKFPKTHEHFSVTREDYSGYSDTTSADP